ncbi:MAG TPA: hypothetical protein VNG90_03980, partial [Candidatus Acidoferrum sp.]|nr:hypothetical protein [Candidatus Acidoferrum sp.]
MRKLFGYRTAAHTFIKTRKNTSPWQRIAALFLLCLTITNVAIPPLSAYAAAQPVTPAAPHKNSPDLKTQMAQNYAGPLVTGGSAVNAARTTTPPSAGQATPSPLDLPNSQPGEIVSKRTATSMAIRNADGTITEKNYLQPINYQKNGSWQKIDTSLVSDQNPTDATNPISQKFDQMTSSWASPSSNLIVKDNSWQARFSPSDSPKGMLRIQQGSNQVGFVPIGAKQVAPVTTTDSTGTQTVHYYDLWPGVNVAYTVYSAQVKETITLKDKNATNQVQFQVIGASLSKAADGGFAINGLDGSFSVAPINLILNSFGYVSDSSNFSQTYQNGVITVAVNKGYLQALPASAFPAVIDPGIDTVSGSNASANYQNVKSDGSICNRSTCDMYTGGLIDGNGIGREWHNYFYAPYSRYQNTNYRLVVAKMYFTMSTGNWFTGTMSNHTVYATRSVCNNAYACNDTNLPWYGGTVGSTGQIDLTQLYLGRIAAGDWGMWLVLSG